MFATSGRKALVLFCFLMSLVLSCAKRGKVRKKNKNNDHTTGLMFVAGAFALCFIPSIIYFVYSVMKDPATPDVVKKLSSSLKENTMSYLSKNDPKNK